MIYQINDIIYTKDGRRSGNLTVVDRYPSGFSNERSLKYSKPLEEKFPYTYVVISDYGNLSKAKYGFASDQFFVVPGKARSTHKYYNYKEKHPEEFI